MSGPVLTDLPSTKVNATHWKWVYRCQNCISMLPITWFVFLGLIIIVNRLVDRGGSSKYPRRYIRCSRLGIFIRGC